MTELVWRQFSGDSGSYLWPLAQNLRWDVFVWEQKVPFVAEIDARDRRASTTHLIGFADDLSTEALATCRILPESNWHYHLGRVAVKEEVRGTGLGKEMLEVAAKIMSSRIPVGSAGLIVLDGQLHARPFYESCGYQATQRPQFLDAGIWHQEMARRIHGSKRDPRLSGPSIII